MKKLLDAVGAATAVGDAAAIAGEHKHPGGDLMFYASGAFTSATLMFSPTKGGAFVPLATLVSAGATKVYAGQGFLRGTVTGTVTAATVAVS